MKNKKEKKSSLRLATEMVQGQSSPEKKNGPLIPPIVNSAVFTYSDTKQLSRFQKRASQGEKNQFEEYGRYGNPGIVLIEDHIAKISGAERAALFSSGMAAITTLLFSLLNSGNHVIYTKDIYRRTRQFITSNLGKLGIQSTEIPPNDFLALETAYIPDKTKCIFIENPSNPHLRVTDLRKLAEFANSNGLISIIDSTFATPVNQKPHEFGVDYVVLSATKYMNGHHDLIAGVVTGKWQDVQTVIDQRSIFGGVIDPGAAFLISRGLKTLNLRVSQQNRTGQIVSEFIQAHDAISKVWYPGLASHPDHAIAIEQMTGFGGVVSFELNGNLPETKLFLDALRIPQIATSFGGLESLVEAPALFTQYSLTKAQREALGVTDNFVRLSLGIEDARDLVEDLQQALAQI